MKVTDEMVDRVLRRVEVQPDPHSGEIGECPLCGYTWLGEGYAASRYGLKGGLRAEVRSLLELALGDE